MGLFGLVGSSSATHSCRQHYIQWRGTRELYLLIGEPSTLPILETDKTMEDEDLCDDLRVACDAVRLREV